MFKTKNLEIAEEECIKLSESIPTRNDNWYLGFCVHDRHYYVGSLSQLRTIECKDIVYSLILKTRQEKISEILYNSWDIGRLDGRNNLQFNSKNTISNKYEEGYEHGQQLHKEYGPTPLF